MEKDVVGIRILCGRNCNCIDLNSQIYNVLTPYSPLLVDLLSFSVYFSEKNKSMRVVSRRWLQNNHLIRWRQLQQVKVNKETKMCCDKVVENLVILHCKIKAAIFEQINILILFPNRKKIWAQCETHWLRIKELWVSYRKSQRIYSESKSLTDEVEKY